MGAGEKKKSEILFGPAEGGSGAGVRRRGVSGGGNEKNQKNLSI